MNGSLVCVRNVDPEPQESKVGEGEEKVEDGELSLTGREIVLRTIRVKIIDLGADDHGDGGFGSAIGKEKAVFIGCGNGVRSIEGCKRRGRKVTESKETGYVVRIKDAEGGVLLDLDEDLNKAFFVEEEEAEVRRLGLRCGREGSDGDGGDGDGNVTLVGEAEFFKQNHGSSVGIYG